MFCNSKLIFTCYLHILIRPYCCSILPYHCAVKLEGGVSWLHPQPGALCLVNASPVEAPVRLSQGCVIVLGKTNMFRYNDPTEAADLRKKMTEKTRKASLMNQSLMSQSLSDLRNPPNRHSGEWKMFASDSDIKDIAEVMESSDASPVSAKEGVHESVSTLTLSAGSGTNTATNTPKKDKDGEDIYGSASAPLASGDSSVLTDINANPRVSTSTPLRRVGGTDDDEKIDLVSPMSETAESLCTSISGPGMEGMVTSTMSGSSSSHSGAVLSQLYNDIYEQKDVIMSCLDEDNCDIEQVRLV